MNDLTKPFKRLPVALIGTGSYVPERRLTNEDLEKMVDTSNEWIVTRTGIEERRIAAPDEKTSDMGTDSKPQCTCGIGRLCMAVPHHPSLRRYLPLKGKAGSLLLYGWVSCFGESEIRERRVRGLSVCGRGSPTGRG